MRTLTLAALFTLLSMPLGVWANPAEPTIVLPDQLHWVAGTGPLSGIEIAPVVGDPSKPGPFVIRLRIPDGGKAAPHYHADTERVTVLSGTFLVGVGDTMNEKAMKALPAGSFVSIPGGVHHYAMAKGVTVIQVGGNGPFELKPVK